LLQDMYALGINIWGTFLDCDKLRRNPNNNHKNNHNNYNNIELELQREACAADNLDILTDLA
ncbi:unnamed protein product, partial [Polarella glacialis]